MRNWNRKTAKTQSVGSIVASVPLQLTAFVLLGLSIWLITSPTLAEPLLHGQSTMIVEKEVTKETVSVQPAQKQKPAQKPNGKKPHPVVIAPEPLLPAVTTANTATTKINPELPLKHIEAPSTATTTINLELPLKPIERAASMVNEDDASEDMSLRGRSKQRKLSRPSVPPPPATKVIAGEHPQALPTKPKSTHEPGFYPVGFTPVARPVTAVQMSTMEKALSHYNRGVYYSQRQQWDNAIAEYNQVLLINQQPLADAYVGISTASLHKRDWENALKSANKALRFKEGFIDPGNITQARYNLSTIYCVADDYHEAKHFYKMVKKAGHPQAPALAAFLEKNCSPKP